MADLNFEGFKKEDFDSYLCEKWKSNVYSRERLETKQRLSRFGSYILQKINESNKFSFDLWSSDHNPSLWNNHCVDSQWIVYARDKGQKKILEDLIDFEKSLAETLSDPSPLKRHAIIYILLNKEGIEFGFRIHSEAWVDRKNLFAKLNKDKKKLEDFYKLLIDSPEAFTTGIINSQESEEKSLKEYSAEEIYQLLNKFQDKTNSWFLVRQFITFEKAIEKGKDILNTATQDILFLLRLFNFSVWSQDNDFMSDQEEIIAKRQKREKRIIELDEQKKVIELKKEEKRNIQLKEKAEIEELNSTTGWVLKASPIRNQAYKKNVKKDYVKKDRNFDKNAREYPVSKNKKVFQDQKEKKVEKIEKSVPQKKITPINFKPEAGMLVKIVNGPMTGKHGKIISIENKSVKILLGMLTMRVDIKDIIPFQKGN